MQKDDERPGSWSLKLFEMDRLVLKGDLSYLVTIIEELFLVVQERMVDGQACNGGNFVEGKIESYLLMGLLGDLGRKGSRWCEKKSRLAYLDAAFLALDRTRIGIGVAQHHSAEQRSLIRRKARFYTLALAHHFFDPAGSQAFFICK